MRSTPPLNLPPRSSRRNSTEKLASFIISILVLSTVFQSFLIFDASAPPGPTTRVVPTTTYPTIQSAIDASSKGDIVQVNPGTYYEHLHVNVANLKIKGTDKYTTILDGSGTGTPVSLEANGITITGFTITDQGTHDFGIKTNSYNGQNITDNIIQNFVDGVYLTQSDSNIIVRNTFYNNAQHAINIGISQGNQITDNIISESPYGIYLPATDNTQILRNNISGTSFGIHVRDSTQNNISNNTEQSNECGIQTFNSDYLTINNNAITGGMYGIQLQTTHDSTLANNTLTEATYGVYFFLSYSNTFGGTRGNLVDNNDWGIVLYNSTGNHIIDGNIVAQSAWGISMLGNSNGNTIYHNNFFSNTKQAFQDITSFGNFWWNTITLEGNYWNPYSGYPPASGVDYYPLSDPWPMRNLAITSVTPSETQFDPGDPVTVNVTVKNFGVITEIAKVTAYYGSNTIGTKTTTLAQDAAQLLTFDWNTFSVLPGEYTISATVEAIPYVERNYADNTLADGTINVGLLGDINHDRIVDSQDLILLKQAFGTVPGKDGWNPDADLNSDSLVNSQDLQLLAASYGIQI